jgi:hypothetical protein
MTHRPMRSRMERTSAAPEDQFRFRRRVVRLPSDVRLHGRSRAVSGGKGERAGVQAGLALNVVAPEQVDDRLARDAHLLGDVGLRAALPADAVDDRQAAVAGYI